MNDPIVIEAQMPAKSQAAADAYVEVKDHKAFIRLKQAQLREELEKDEEYKKAKADRLEIERKLRQKKNQLMRQPLLIQMEKQIDDLKADLKTKQLTLFVELDKYTAETKQYVLPLEDDRKVIERVYKLTEFE